jgi:hypothetical protein
MVLELICQNKVTLVHICMQNRTIGFLITSSFVKHRNLRGSGRERVKKLAASLTSNATGVMADGRDGRLPVAGSTVVGRTIGATAASGLCCG